MNPNNRRVLAMIVWGQFVDQRRKPKPSVYGETQSPERLIVLAMDTVRYLTADSGFLHIKSDETERYKDFDSRSFRSPNMDWTPPYPYCPDDILFPIEQREMKYQRLKKFPRSLFVLAWEENSLREQLLANDSLGG
jgi:hypothetical protein